MNVPATSSSNPAIRYACSDAGITPLLAAWATTFSSPPTPIITRPGIRRLASTNSRPIP